MDQKEKTVIKTKDGKIQGTYQNGIYVFKGIPYAVPPIGELRWLPPEPVKPWKSVRQAQAFGSGSPQNSGGPDFPDFRMNDPQSEDCLYLNVWSPGLDDARRPVLFWIHGGAFALGAGSQSMHEGSKLAARNVVVITINYRLGLLGFLNLNEVTGGRIPSTGNEGLLDQIAALEWVRDNVAAFGGDPDNVTVFGQSAGGMSIGSLMAMPKARGLFHKAIMQSGVGNESMPLAEAVKIAEKFISILGLNAGDTAALRALTVNKLLSTQLELLVKLPRPTGEPRTTVTMPIIDGKLLKEWPMAAIAHGSAGNIPIIVGSNLEEWKLFVLEIPGLAKIDEAGVIRRCQLQFSLPVEQAQRLVEAYRKARAQRGDGISPLDIFCAIQTDRMFRMPGIYVVEKQSQYNPHVYSYLFSWKSPVKGGILGACHSMDVGFVFGTYNNTFCGEGPAADRLCRNIQDAWTSFARTGDPSCESAGTWLPYGDRRVTMFLNERCHLEEAPYDEERRIWDSIPGSLPGIR